MQDVAFKNTNFFIFWKWKLCKGNPILYLISEKNVEISKRLLLTTVKHVLLVFPANHKKNSTVRILKTPKTESSVRKIFLPKYGHRCVFAYSGWWQKKYWSGTSGKSPGKSGDAGITQFAGEDNEIMVEKGASKEKIGLRGPMPPGMLFAVYDSETGAAEYIPPEYIDIPDLLDELVEREWQQMGTLLSEGAEVQILLETCFKAFVNVSWISWQRTLFLFSDQLFFI